jgi:hypothetical protein
VGVYSNGVGLLGIVKTAVIPVPLIGIKLVIWEFADTPKFMFKMELIVVVSTR